MSLDPQLLVEPRAVACLRSRAAGRYTEAAWRARGNGVTGRSA